MEIRRAHHYWGRQKSGTYNFNWDFINEDSTVLVAASECDSNGKRFIGDAHFRVNGIAARSRAVTFGLNTGWRDPIYVRTDFLVINP